MLKVLYSVVVAATCLLCSADVSQAGCFAAGGKSPVQSPVQAPGPMTARAEGGYRTYSYEPGPVYRSQGRRRYSPSRPSYLDARSKALGWSY
jgi:hypothetical protein